MPGSLRGLPQTRAAVAYAERMHDGQWRVDGAPFVHHALEVGALLYYAGAPDHVIAAGVLHDAIEKTDALASDLRKRFGSRVTGLVLAVSENRRIAGYVDRKAALRKQVARAGDEALMVFAADKVSRVSELRRRGAREERRLTHYKRSLEVLEARLPDSPLVSELRRELGSLKTGAVTTTAVPST